MVGLFAASPQAAPCLRRLPGFPLLSLPEDSRASKGLWWWVIFNTEKGRFSQREWRNVFQFLILDRMAFSFYFLLSTFHFPLPPQFLIVKCFAVYSVSSVYQQSKPFRSAPGNDRSVKPTGMRRHGADRGLVANSPTRTHLAPCSVYRKCLRCGRGHA